MADVLLTLHCAAGDTDIIAEVVRSACAAPLHIRPERVRGLDFEDAVTAEKVRGELRRSALELIVDDKRIAALLEVIGGCRKASPVRWRATPIVDHGRIP